MYVCIMSMHVRNIVCIIEVVYKEDLEFVQTFEFSVNSFQSRHILLSEIYKILSTKNNADDKPFLWHWTWFLDIGVIPIWEQQNRPQQHSHKLSCQKTVSWVVPCLSLKAAPTELLQEPGIMVALVGK